ncbi:hypothetical protein Lesp02_69930 [Lentzea sp. NBRC 105346]|uniref:hypothetical protein n=1 Tax=Lentzea sp. NBRC 105346 TaxID=3032205 RepID=UPI0024A1DEFD|nr:hypothetical protein [Lentzea sp. NBRC 105346]GLZ34806.1 hypothetical protein Lesp02_69930 [Lentzea sp. NBRC 105346]
MKRTITAALTTGAALLSLTAPALAGGSGAATSAPYLLGEEGVAVAASAPGELAEYAEASRSGIAQSLPGWRVDLTDAHAVAAVTTGKTQAGSSGRFALTDMSANGWSATPFLVVDFPEHAVSCTPDGPHRTESGTPDVSVRREHLTKVDPSAGAVTIDGVGSGDGKSRGSAKIEVTPVQSARQLAGFPKFARFTEAAVTGYRVTITEHGTAHTFLVGASAASC